MTDPWLLGADVAEEIARIAEGNPKAALKEILKFARAREKALKDASEKPPQGFTRDGLYGMGMATEFLADVIEGILLRMEES